jgi:periplasmic divalent cation tolerance protein
MKAGGEARIVLVTCDSLMEGRKIAKAIVRKRLAACVNLILGPVQSIYRWKKKVELAREHLLVIKTTRKRLKDLEREVLRLHSYDVPEFLVLPVSAGSNKYLSWLTHSVSRRMPAD